MKRFLCTSLVALVAVAWSLPALAQNGKITGKVEATPPKYLEETVVYLKEVKGTPAPKTATMDQKGMKFIPHVLAITAGDTVKFLNDDAVAHNVYSSDAEGFNLGSFPKGESRTNTFKKAGTYTILCSIHPEMLAFIFVGQNPYSAVVGKDGTFEIANVPPGTYQLAIWNSKLKAPEQSVTVAAAKPAQATFSLKR
ncbi:MAG TPA: plastocyanin/azurin family copper-binding protein [Myxococcales bacterium]|jgi:plastocyanin